MLLDCLLKVLTSHSQCKLLITGGIRMGSYAIFFEISDGEFPANQRSRVELKSRINITLSVGAGFMHGAISNKSYICSQSMRLELFLSRPPVSLFQSNRLL